MTGLTPDFIDSTNNGYRNWYVNGSWYTLEYVVKIAFIEHMSGVREECDGHKNIKVYDRNGRLVGEFSWNKAKLR